MCKHKELLEKLDSVPEKLDSGMKEIAPGTTAIDLTASHIDLSDEIEERANEMIKELAGK